jgi:hypothetical protein
VIVTLGAPGRAITWSTAGLSRSACGCALASATIETPEDAPAATAALKAAFPIAELEASRPHFFLISGNIRDPPNQDLSYQLHPHILLVNMFWRSVAVLICNPVSEYQPAGRAFGVNLAWIGAQFLESIFYLTYST